MLLLLLIITLLNNQRNSIILKSCNNITLNKFEVPYTTFNPLSLYQLLKRKIFVLSSLHSVINDAFKLIIDIAI